ncbi:uncharacterized protein LOC123229952 [Mangifera indica]|uniref:uncharacterized protein LOC123229952 n=1 Tax=Mangifera indica TaxID=29780 RepID=UPI001CFA43B3|nr:uncharacterized protein LOC123229952 [Mangifera indica]XP_044511943.1 uncharacterized protein LOC123229952 [Mangifera indica]
MGNVIASFFSGFGQVLGNLFGAPLDFLAGKSCSSVCGPTWDFICYIENFCLANLLKLAIVLALLYLLLLFFYLLYKLGICWCIGHSLCKMVWACLVTWFSFWEYCFTFLCVKLIKFKRRNQRGRRNIVEIGQTDSSYEQESSSSESFSSDDIPRSNYSSRRGRDYREAHRKKSLRPRSYRVQVGISRRNATQSHRRNSLKHHSHGSQVHDHIRVTHTSRFVKKGRSIRRGVYGNQKW